MYSISVYDSFHDDVLIVSVKEFDFSHPFGDHIFVFWAQLSCGYLIVTPMVVCAKGKPEG